MDVDSSTMTDVLCDHWLSFDRLFTSLLASHYLSLCSLVPISMPFSVCASQSTAILLNGWPIFYFYKLYKYPACPEISGHVCSFICRWSVCEETSIQIEQNKFLSLVTKHRCNLMLFHISLSQQEGHSDLIDPGTTFMSEILSYE
jgi:hypothetical protein